jgi:hypothetical protein
VKVTLLVPTLNEEKGIGPTLDGVDRAAFAAKGWELEFLVIDGDSKDRTKLEAEARGARVVIEPRRGYGRAYKRGFAEATGDIIVTADADGTYPVERAHELAQMLLDQGVDFLNGDRYANLAPGAMSGKHKFGNWVLSTTARILFSVRMKDSQSGLWVIRRAALEGIDMERLSEGMAFSQEIKLEFFKRLDRKAAEVPASLRPRIGKPVLSSWKDGLRNLKMLFVMRVTRHW